MTRTITAFDTETTGLNTQTDHIVELGLVKFNTETWEILGEKKVEVMKMVVNGTCSQKGCYKKGASRNRKIVQPRKALLHYQG